MELEIAKISPARIRRVSSECLSILPRKKHLSGKYTKCLYEKFISATFASGKFYARIYYILDFGFTKSGTISKNSSIWLPESIKIYVNAKNCTDKNVIQYIGKEYRKEALEYFNDMGGYLFNHMIYNTKSKELLSAFFSGIEKSTDIPELDSLKNCDYERVCMMAEIFPKDYLSLMLWDLDPEDIFNLVKKFPEKFSCIKFLEGVFRSEYDKYDYILDAFQN